MFGFAEKLNIENFVNSVRICVDYICTDCLHWQTNWKSGIALIQWEIVYFKCTECVVLRRNWISKISKKQREIVYIIYVRNTWICKQIEYPEIYKVNGNLCTLNVRSVWFCEESKYSKFHKFSGKLCTLYMYRISAFAEKLNILKYINSTGNIVHYTYGVSGYSEILKI